MADTPRAVGGSERGRLPGRMAQIVGLAVLCGVGAELLAAYAETTGDLGGVTFSLVFFAALYGAPALLARELVRRAGWGWPSLLVIFLALGVTQACLIDQAMFSIDYQGYEGWEATREATLIPGTGVGAFNLYNFLGGHLIFSFGAPVALAEAWRPAHRERSWLGPIGIIVALVAYIVAAVLILADPESHSASPTQLALSALTVLALLTLAALVGRSHRRNVARTPVEPVETPRRFAPAEAPPVWVVFVVVLVLALAAGFADENWAGVGLGVGATVLTALLVWRLSRGRGWGARHVAAVAVPFLLVRGSLAFTYFPLAGSVEPVAKYTHNVIMLLIVLLASWFALRKDTARHDPMDRASRNPTSSIR